MDKLHVFVKKFCLIRAKSKQAFVCSFFPGGGVLIYSGGDAANLAVAYQGSESQAAENDQKSGYNNQNLGMGVSEEDEEEMEEEEKKRK